MKYTGAFFKDKGAKFAAAFLLTAGTWAWIQEGYFNIFTGVTYSLAAFIFIVRNYGK